MAIDFRQEFGVNAGYVETLYEKWRQDQSLVEPEWSSWFAHLSGTAPAKSSAATATATEESAPPAVRDPEPKPADDGESEDATVERLKGVAGKIATNMNDSLSVPTASSVRELSVKVLAENRHFINGHMKVRALGKASYTHLVAFALVRAIAENLDMTSAFEDRDGVPYKVTPKRVNLGLAIDMETRSGRSLVVANIKAAETLGFREFHEVYEDLVRRARDGKLTAADFQGTTVTLSNPGGFGTHMSAPRLMKGQGVIIAIGKIGIPTACAGMAASALARLAIGPVMTMNSTYDHRVIQGAESGLLLKRVDDLLQGADGFYDQIYRDLRVPWRPVLPAGDTASDDNEHEHAEKQAKVWKLMTAYRSRGCRIADLDPLEYKPDWIRSLDLSWYGFTMWDLDREYLCGGLDGKTFMPLREILLALSATYCRRWTIEYMHIANRRRKQWVRDRVELRRDEQPFDDEKRRWILSKLYEAENFERFLHTRYVGNKRFSLEGADTLIPALAEVIERAAESGVEKVVLGMAHRGRLNVLANILNKSNEQIFSEFEAVMWPLSGTMFRRACGSFSNKNWAYFTGVIWSCSPTQTHVGS